MPSGNDTITVSLVADELAAEGNELVPSLQLQLMRGHGQGVANLVCLWGVGAESRGTCNCQKTNDS